MQQIFIRIVMYSSHISILHYQIVTIPLHKRLTMIRGKAFRLTHYFDTWDCYIKGVILLTIIQLCKRYFCWSRRIQCKERNSIDHLISKTFKHIIDNEWDVVFLLICSVVFIFYQRVVFHFRKCCAQQMRGCCIKAPRHWHFQP